MRDVAAVSESIGEPDAVHGRTGLRLVLGCVLMTSLGACAVHESSPVSIPEPPSESTSLAGSGGHEVTVSMVERSARWALAEQGFEAIDFQGFRLPASMDWSAVLAHYQPLLAEWHRIDAIPEQRLAAQMRAWTPVDDASAVLTVILIDSPEPGAAIDYHVLLVGTGSAKTGSGDGD